MVSEKRKKLGFLEDWIFRLLDSGNYLINQFSNKLINQFFIQQKKTFGGIVNKRPMFSRGKNQLQSSRDQEALTFSREYV